MPDKNDNSHAESTGIERDSSVVSRNRKDTYPPLFANQARS